MLNGQIDASPSVASLSLGSKQSSSQAQELRWEVSSAVASGRFSDSLVERVFSLVREASFEVRGEAHYPVQWRAGKALVAGRIVEMQTGEGKTLTATLPVAFQAMTGRGVHVMTVNDYLAKRDAQEMGEVYARLGLTTGYLQSDQEPGSPERRKQYDCDITYGTVNEFGFDFLRDRLHLLGERKNAWTNGVRTTMQRPLYYALIDEADSILLDEARTPLLLNLPQEPDEIKLALYDFATQMVSRLEPGTHFEYRPDERRAILTHAGVNQVLFTERSFVLQSMNQEDLFHQVEQAIAAQLGLHKERDYVLQETEEKTEVVLIDESTGRPLPGRQWSDGLHQAVELKEQVPLSPQTGEAAKITIQSLLKLYRKTAGMTGTAAGAKRELRKLYKQKVSIIPTHRPCLRVEMPPRIFSTAQAKYQAVTKAIRLMLSQQRPVLVGTSSIRASEQLSELLAESDIDHQILNARYLEREAEIVADAGQPGAVTIATNMAGRGTDIKLHPDVKQNGGLHVIATEMHSSARIDRQLVGRAARQGDPGSSQFFLSLEDDLLKATAQRLPLPKINDKNGRELSVSYLKYFEKAQRFLEKQHRKSRKTMLKAEEKRLKTAHEMGTDPFSEFLS